MSKLPKQHQFLDVSDYGRLVARWIANSLKSTSFTPIHVTSLFIISGFLAICCILYDYYVLAAMFLILKSILDAADGELARIKKTPSYIGRYYDSIADIILNFLFLFTFWYITNTALINLFLAFIGIQLQGTLYNYYHVILRNKVNGDLTSRVFEYSTPTAFEGESQYYVNIFHKIYNFLYYFFDRTIYLLDSKAMNSQPFPRWFMTLLSAFGLGFQLLIMAVMLVLRLEEFVIPFFMGYSFLIVIFILIRRLFLK